MLCLVCSSLCSSSLAKVPALKSTCNGQQFEQCKPPPPIMENKGKCRRVKGQKVTWSQVHRLTRLHLNTKNLKGHTCDLDEAELGNARTNLSCNESWDWSIWRGCNYCVLDIFGRSKTNIWRSLSSTLKKGREGGREEGREDAEGGRKAVSLS